MTIEQAKKELVDYFGLELNSHSNSKLESVLKSVERIEKRFVVQKKYIYVDVEYADGPADLDKEASRIAEMYDTTVERMKSPRRDHNAVGARAHLVREMRINKRVTVKRLGQFLNRDHSTIIHLAYESKATCQIKPLHRFEKIKI